MIAAVTDGLGRWGRNIVEAAGGGGLKIVRAVSPLSTRARVL